MDSPQSIVSPFKSSLEPERQKPDFFMRTTNLSKGIDAPRKEAMVNGLEDFIGVLDVYVHQARDIHNICIYQKQDVYAKLCLTSDPENAVSTKIINGGGRNPVFNDNVRLNVKTVDSSLKCEIYMMSRVRNYLEDQLLGFALVPLSDVVIKDGKLEKEFSLSSTDLFHSPAGFVQLSLAYNGASPEVMEITTLPRAVANDETMQDPEIPKSLPCEYENIEFPDPKVVNENQMMVSEYFGIPCTNLDSECLVTSDAENHLSSKVGALALESLSATTTDSIQAPELDSSPSSLSSHGVSSPSAAASSESSDTPVASKSPPQEDHVSGPNEKTMGAGDVEHNSSNGVAKEKIQKPVITVNMEPEQNVVQQDIVDMYVKSMQQFSDSLAKMKLPLDIDTRPASSGDSSSDQKSQGSKTPGSRVFYGSRAFF